MNSSKKIYAIIPARSGSKGLPNKNIKLLNGHPLLAYSINFAKVLNVNRIICSTDSEEYAKIAINYGAEVPFLRGTNSSADNAMEEDILKDLYAGFIDHNIDFPDLFVWLRPTFVFRKLEAVQQCISKLIEDTRLSAARTICESESRLYRLDSNSELSPIFDDHGKSMIRRQDVGTFYKVYSTDVFRGKPRNDGSNFLGNNILGVSVPKVCGLDIDDLEDFQLIETLLKHEEGVQKYIY